MRTAVKKRLYFLATAIVIYSLGFHWLPQDLALPLFPAELTAHYWLAQLPLLLAVIGYFVVLPMLYWQWVIKAGQQKSWKIILVFSLSLVCARYSFPSQVSEYFAFISYIRYPIIGVLLAIQCYLFAIVIKGLWQARKLSGDPRIHAAANFSGQDNKQALALMMASEPASWYYAIPYFSRDHVKAIATLQLRSAKAWWWLTLLSACAIAGIGSYWLIAPWSELAAVIVASFCFYSVIMVTANYRVARYYSVYVYQDKLIINPGFLQMMVIDLAAISAINTDNALLSKEDRSKDDNCLVLGDKTLANVELVFNQPQTYFGLIGQMAEEVSSLQLAVEDPKPLLTLLVQPSLAKAS
ncbi:hypothetical protein [Colwellia sp. MEBiC06753]